MGRAATILGKGVNSHKSIMTKTTKGSGVETSRHKVPRTQKEQWRFPFLLVLSFFGFVNCSAVAACRYSIITVDRTLFGVCGCCYPFFRLPKKKKNTPISPSNPPQLIHSKILDGGCKREIVTIILLRFRYPVRNWLFVVRCFASVQVCR